MKWYPRNVGDYAASTRTLSMLEHGAYTLLLDYYYATETPLPVDPVQLHRVCMAVTDAEQCAVASVITRFFTREADGYHHAVVTERIIKTAQIRAARSQAANARWGKRSDANAMPTQYNQKPEVNKKKKKPPAIGFDAASGSFTDLSEEQIAFWRDAYPGVEIDAELRRAAAWIDANPSRAPTTRVKSFLNAWLAKSAKALAATLPKGVTDHAVATRQKTRSAIAAGLTGRDRRQQAFVPPAAD